MEHVHCTLKKRDLKFIAIDISVIALKRDREQKLCKICADAQFLPFRPFVFGSILCLDVLEHLPKP